MVLPVSFLILNKYDDYTVIKLRRIFDAPVEKFTYKLFCISKNKNEARFISEKISGIMKGFGKFQLR